MNVCMQLRPYAGNKLVAQRLAFIAGTIQLSCKAMLIAVGCRILIHLRCMPQVHGASRNAWLHLKELTEIELNAVTDNPIILFCR